ncbi:carboxymuconolactone decarboxylase family protein [Parasedimentitalea maritima]|uniref:Carboxymuconolactone decarboxylase family protein n=1 Tax=Parasedimentitalea maritima TaxID=2578117 RepID=A0A6A4RJP8_9RHOB|nr:carboxymuconolactone decarboxylase family protein [Zongyanglinia marina]KAE9629638.1 carboxymuconolactone decarboxylase family protein [Zongyanglinia marina]
MSDALQKGRDLLADMNPGLEQLLADRYDALVPGMAETLVEYGYGRHYARAGVDLKTRQLCTIAALTALGGHTAPQLKVNIENSLAAGASETEIIEVIWQMALYGGMPAAINGLNAAMEVFDPVDGP